MVSVLQIRLPFTNTALPGPGSVRHPFPIHFITRFCASVSFSIACFPSSGLRLVVERGTNLGDALRTS